MKKSSFYRLITITCVSTLLLSGCRFGNHADPAKPLKQDVYKSLELFYTSAVQLESKVILNSLDGPDSVVHENLHGPLTAIPDLFSSAFGSIVYFAVPIDPNSNPSIVNYFNTNAAFYTQVDPANGNPYYVYPDRNKYVLWENTSCGFSKFYTHDGSFDRTQAETLQTSSGKKVEIAGALLFNYYYSLQFFSVNGDHNCDADLTFLANCYKTGSNAGVACSHDALEYSKELFDVPVRSGTLDLNDVTKLKALEYTIHYQ